MTDPRQKIDPKQLYRRLTELVNRLEHAGPFEGLLEPFVDELFRILRPLISARALLVYAEHSDGFALSARSGDCEEVPARLLHRDLSFLRSLERTRYRLFPDPGIDPISGADLPPGNAAVAVLVGEPPRRYLLLLVLDEGWSPEDVELTMNTVRVSLGSRLTEERMRLTLLQAAAIQTSLLVDEAPPFPGYEIAFRTLAADAVGGDFYDFLAFDTDILGLAVGDASGHGLPAALLVRDVVTGLRMGLEKELKVSHVFTKLNRVIYRSKLTTRFVSLFYGELEPNGNLIYVNAGHEPPLLFLQDRLVELRTGGTVIGPLPEVRFKRGFAHVDRGATLVMTSDGIHERRNDLDEQFGRERLIEVVRKHEARPAAEILEAVFAAATRHGGDRPWEDDATLVVVKREASRVPPA